MIITIFILDQFVKLKQSEKSAISIFAWSKATLRTKKKKSLTQFISIYRCSQMWPDVTLQSLYYHNIILKNKKKHDFGFGPFCHSRTETQIRTCAAHSATNAVEVLCSACSSKTFNHTNSDYIHKHTVPFRNDCCVRQRWFSSPVYYTFLCRSCVFFNKGKKKAPKSLFGLIYIMFIYDLGEKTL